MQVTIPRKRGRPRKDGQSPAANLVRPTKLPVPATVEGLAPAVVRQKVAQAVAAGTLDAVALLHGLVLQGLQQLKDGVPVRREPLGASKTLLAMAGIGARSSQVEAKDLSTMTRAELEAFVALGEAQQARNAAVTIEGEPLNIHQKVS